MKSVIAHPRLGEVTVSQTRRATRISISVRPPGAVRLSLPCSVPLAEAIRFLDERAEWVERTRMRLAEKYPADPVGMPFRTRWHELSLFPGEAEKITVRVTADRVCVAYPADLRWESDPVQKAVRTGIEEAWRAEAKAILPERTRQLAERYGLKYRSVSVRNTVSKWGSCSSRNDLSLSIHLMRLPDYLVDYIIIHELCHTVHHNHGPRFHALLDRLTGGRHAELRREMRRQQTRW